MSRDDARAATVVLLVEARGEHRDALRWDLECAGYITTCASTLRDAREKYGAGVIRIVIIDLDLPDEPGEMFAAQAVRERARVVVRSSEGNAAAVARALGARYVPRTASSAEMIRAIRESMN